MEKKKDFIFVGNGRINPTETITNITIMLEKIPKELLWIAVRMSLLPK